MNDDTNPDPIDWRDFLKGLGKAMFVIAICFCYVHDTGPTHHQKQNPKKQNTPGKKHDSIGIDSNTIHYYDAARIGLRQHVDSVTQPQRK